MRTDSRSIDEIPLCGWERARNFLSWPCSVSLSSRMPGKVGMDFIPGDSELHARVFCASSDGILLWTANRINRPGPLTLVFPGSQG